MARGSATTGEAVFVERDAEVARIDELQRTAQGGAGSAVLIEGGPGIGKTALLGVAHRLADSEVTVLDARASELERELGFAVVRQLFAPLLATALDHDGDELLAGAAGLAKGPLGLTDASRPGSEAGALHGLYWLTANLADRGPILMTVDDLHWTDEPSLRFLSYLARRCGDHPLLICVASRPEREERAQLRALIDEAWAEVLRPAPLSEKGVTEVVRRTLSDAAAPEFCAACARSSGGNPFLLVEALNALRADGVAPTAAEAGRLQGLRPESVATAVLARIARLGPAATAIATSMAILGRDVNLRRASALAGIEHSDAAAAVDELRREGVVADREGLDFSHPLVRTAVYADIAEPGRGLRHLATARLLESEGESPDRITPHLLAAEPDGDPWVVGTLRAAAEGALARGAPEPAVALLERALREPPAQPDRAELLLGLGRALGRTGRLQAAAEALRTSLELTDDPERRVAAAVDLGLVLRLGQRPAEAVGVLTAAADALGDEHADLKLSLETEIAMASHMGAPASEWMGRFARVVERSMDSDSGGARVARGAYAYVAAITSSRRAPEVAALARSAARGTSASDPPLTLQLVGAGLAMGGDLTAALALLDDAVDAARELGDASQWSFALLSRQWVALRAGRVLEAEADARACLSVSEEGPATVPYVVGSLMLALIERDDLAAAQSLMEEHGLTELAEVGELPDYTFLNVRARLSRMQGRPREALDDLVHVKEVVEGIGLVGPCFSEWRRDAAQASLALGDLEAARRFATDDVAAAREWGGARELAIALRSLGLVQGGERGIELLRESVGVVEGSEAVLELGRSRGELGAALRRAGLRREARDELRQALDLASSMGALRIAERAREELRAAGARPRRGRTSGPESLTASEMRVARMAAEGRSNPEIAQALFVTRRTVEVHLTNAYRKLEISSRAELPGALASEDPA